MDIINCLLFIIIIQDKSLFRFDGNFDSDVTRIQKRKLAENKAKVYRVSGLMYSSWKLAASAQDRDGHRTDQKFA